MEESNLDMAAKFEKKGDYEQALTYYMKALDERKAALGEGHPGVASLYATIGRVLHDQGNYDMAVSHYEKALKIRRAVHRAYHPKVAAICETIGNILNDTGDYDKALSYYEKSLDACSSEYGKYHPCLIALHERMEKILSNKGDEENARAHHEKARKIESIRLGLDVPDEVWEQMIKQMQEDKKRFSLLPRMKEDEASYLVYDKCRVKLTEKITIGRATDNDLIVDDSFVSRHHCIIQKIKDAYFLKDVGSTNGTFLNGVRIPQDKYRRLRCADRIFLASTIPIYIE